MPKPPASWKAWERRVAKIFGGKRRGAYVSDGKIGKNDIIVDGWSIEVKLLKRPTYQQMFDACIQAEKNSEISSDIPIAIVKKKGVRDKNALVIMRLEQFKEFFV
jgi:hypothetical protein